MGLRETRLDSKDRSALVDALVEEYERNPDAVRKALPRVAQLLEEAIPFAQESGEWQLFKLTNREAAERMQLYQTLVSRLKRGKERLSAQEAVEALEHAAAIIEGSFTHSIHLDSGDLTRLVRLATGLSMAKEGRPRRQTLAEGAAARRVSLLRGVRADLTWDKRLLAVEVLPQALRQRERALRFVGVGLDPARDVAERHDDYLAKEPPSA